LIYATESQDGRPPYPRQSSATHQCYGGLWSSVDGAANWFHVELCSALGSADNIASVIFSGGRPFVATDCGIWSTQDSNLGNCTWTRLPALPNGISPAGTILAPSSNSSETLFGCLAGAIECSAVITPRMHFPRRIGADAWFSDSEADRYEVHEQSLRTAVEEILTLIIITDEAMLRESRR
jgi:hypothetical protein